MDIISKGHLPKDQVFNATCRNCGTIFTFRQDEAEQVPDVREGDYMRVTCPLEGCGNRISSGLTKINVGR